MPTKKITQAELDRRRAMVAYVEHELRGLLKGQRLLTEEEVMERLRFEKKRQLRERCRAGMIEHIKECEGRYLFRPEAILAYEFSRLQPTAA